MRKLWFLDFEISLLITLSLSVSIMTNAQKISPGIFYAKFGSALVDSAENHSDDEDAEAFIMINFKNEMTFSYFNSSSCDMGKGVFHVQENVLTLTFQNVPDNNCFDRTEKPTGIAGESMVVITIIDKISNQSVTDAVVHIRNRSDIKYNADAPGSVRIPKDQLKVGDLLIIKRKGFLFQELMYDGFHSISCYSTRDIFLQEHSDPFQFSIGEVGQDRMKLGFEMSVSFSMSDSTSLGLNFVKITDTQVAQLLKQVKHHISFMME